MIRRRILFHIVFAFFRTSFRDCPSLRRTPFMCRIGEDWMRSFERCGDLLLKVGELFFIDDNARGMNSWSQSSSLRASPVAKV